MNRVLESGSAPSIIQYINRSASLSFDDLNSINSYRCHFHTNKLSSFPTSFKMSPTTRNTAKMNTAPSGGKDVNPGGSSDTASSQNSAVVNFRDKIIVLVDSDSDIDMGSTDSSAAGPRLSGRAAAVAAGLRQPLPFGQLAPLNSAASAFKSVYFTSLLRAYQVRMEHQLWTVDEVEREISRLNGDHHKPHRRHITLEAVETADVILKGMKMLFSGDYGHHQDELIPWLGRLVVESAQAISARRMEGNTGAQNFLTKLWDHIDTIANTEVPVRPMAPK